MTSVCCLYQVQDNSHPPSTVKLTAAMFMHGIHPFSYAENCTWIPFDSHAVLFPLTWQELERSSSGEGPHLMAHFPATSEFAAGSLSCKLSSQLVLTWQSTVLQAVVFLLWLGSFQGVYGYIFMDRNCKYTKVPLMSYAQKSWKMTGGCNKELQRKIRISEALTRFLVGLLCPYLLLLISSPLRQTKLARLHS